MARCHLFTAEQKKPNVMPVVKMKSDVTLLLVIGMLRSQLRRFVGRLENHPKSQAGHKGVVVVVVAAGVGNELQVWTDREPRCHMVSVI